MRSRYISESSIDLEEDDWPPTRTEVTPCCVPAQGSGCEVEVMVWRSLQKIISSDYNCLRSIGRMNEFGGAFSINVKD